MEITDAKIIKTAVVEDIRDIREGLTTLINFTDGFTCTGSYRSMEDAIHRIKSDVPDVLLSDIGLPGIDGYELARRLREIREASQGVSERTLRAAFRETFGLSPKQYTIAQRLRAAHDAGDGRPGEQDDHGQRDPGEHRAGAEQSARPLRDGGGHHA